MQMLKPRSIPAAFGGSSLSVSRFCPNCGRPVPGGNNFCASCGFALSPQTGGAPPIAPSVPPPVTPPPAYPYPGYAPAPPPAYWPGVRRATFSDMFSGVMDVWTKHFVEFFVVYLVLTLVTSGLSLLGSILLLHVPISAGGFGGISFTSPTGVDIAAFIGYEFVVIVIGLVLGSIVLGGVTDFSVRAYRGEPVRLEDSLRRGIQRFLSILGANLLVTLITVGVVFIPILLLFVFVLGGVSTASIALLCGVLLAFPFLLVLIIYLYLALLLYAPAIMVEGATAVDSLGRSWNLTKGHKWSLFGASLVIGIIAALLSGAISLAGGLTGNLVVSVLATALATGVTGAWAAILAAVAYDLIVREPRASLWPPAYMPPSYPPR